MALNVYKPHRWAVVHDLSPFGIRIECTHRWRWRALACWGGSRHLQVMPSHEAVERDRALAASFTRPFIQ